MIISIIVIVILTIGLYQWLWLRVGTGTWPDIESDTKPKLGSNQLFTHFLLMKHSSGSRNGNMGTRGQFSWNYWKKWLSSWSLDPLLCRVGGEDLFRQERIPGEAPADWESFQQVWPQRRRLPQLGGIPPDRPRPRDGLQDLLGLLQGGEGWGGGEEGVVAL